jgi:hypothetical protein
LMLVRSFAAIKSRKFCMNQRRYDTRTGEYIRATRPSRNYLMSRATLVGKYESEPERYQKMNMEQYVPRIFGMSVNEYMAQEDRSEMAAHLGSPHGPADLDAIPFPAWQCPIPPLPTFTGLNDIALPLDVHYMKDLVSQKKKRPSRAGGVDDLQELCTQKGLPTKGLKADLVRWLAAYDAAPTDSGRASAQQSAARDASKIREEKTKRSKLHFVQPEGRCKCNVQLRQCKRCWGIGICDHNEVKSECWECAEQSPGEDLPLAKRTLGQLRVAYDRQGLNEKYCPQAAKTSRRQTFFLLTLFIEETH